MAKRRRELVEHPAVRQMQDVAWNIKDTGEDFFERALPSTDEREIHSIRRELERCLQRLVALRDKRKRAPLTVDVVIAGTVAEASADTGVTPPLFPSDGGGTGPLFPEDA